MTRSIRTILLSFCFSVLLIGGAAFSVARGELLPVAHAQDRVTFDVSGMSSDQVAQLLQDIYDIMTGGLPNEDNDEGLGTGFQICGEQSFLQAGSAILADNTNPACASNLGAFSFNQGEQECESEPGLNGFYNTDDPSCSFVRCPLAPVVTNEDVYCKDNLSPESSCTSPDDSYYGYSSAGDCVMSQCPGTPDPDLNSTQQDDGLIYKCWNIDP